MRGRKRHIVVDTDGRLLVAQTGPACVQDRDGAGPLLKASRGLYPFVERAFADAAYAGERVAAATRIAVEIVRKATGQVGFAGAGWWSAASRGSAATGASPATSRPPSRPRPPSSTPLPSCRSSAGWHVPHEFRNGHSGGAGHV